MEAVPDPPWWSNVVLGEAIMNIHITDEVIFAANASIGDNCTLVSRRIIEEHILMNGDLYPLLHQATQELRRSAISQVMNARFPVWSENRGIHQSSFVWKVRSNQEDTA